MNPRDNLRGQIKQTWTGDDCSGCTDVPSVAEILQGSTNQNASGVSEINAHDADLIAAVEHLEGALSALLGDINDSIATTNAKLEDVKTKLDTLNTKTDTSNTLLTQIELNTRSE